MDEIVFNTYEAKRRVPPGVAASGTVYTMVFYAALGVDRIDERSWDRKERKARSKCLLLPARESYALAATRSAEVQTGCRCM